MSNRVRETEQRRQEQVQKDRQNAEANRAKQKAGQQTFQQQMKSQGQKQSTTTQSPHKDSPKPTTTPPQAGSLMQRSALHARQGIQAKHFQSVLEERGTENITTTRKNHNERGVETDESSRSEQALLKELDRLEQEHPTVEGPFEEASGQPGQQSNRQGQSSEHQGQSGDGNQIQGVGGPSGAAGSGEAALKANAIRALVDQLFVGFQGAKSPTVMIELKGDLFRGTRVELTMKDGKLSLKFESPDPNLRRLLSSSRGELERALEGKGLRLSRLEVKERE